MVHADLHRRATDFAPDVFYVFENTISPNNSLWVGDGALSMGTITASSSENWQLYHQQGRYFIRNYDYRGQWQLGLTEDSPVVPQLMKRSGALGQQWIPIRQDDGTFRLFNGLLGNGSALALAGDGVSQPGMQSTVKGSTWEIKPNLQAGGPGNRDITMMEDVDNFEVQTAVISSAPTSTTPTSLPSGIVSQTPNPALPSLTGAPNSGVQSTTKSTSLAPGAIAGAAIGGAVLLALLALVGYYVWARRKPKVVVLPSTELGTAALVADDKAYYTHNVGGVPPPPVYAHHGGPAQLDGTVRYEM